MKISLDQTYSAEEYLSMLENSEQKYEFHNGRLYDNSGVTGTHSSIAVNMITQLNNAFAEQDCSVFGSDMQVTIPELNRYVFPDVSVVCEKEKFEDKAKMRLRNPTLVVEVYPEFNQAFDKFSKLHLYRQIPSFREYVLILTDRIGICTYYKVDAELWKISSAFNLDDSIHLYSVGVDLPLREVYKKIKGLKEGI